MTHRLAVLTVSVVFAGSTTLSAQPPSTGEGVAAFVRGDHARAVAILQPAAEQWLGPPFDDTAAFFMAMMYENGIGVPPDPVRACALLLRSMFSSTTLLSSAVMTLADDLQKRLGPDQLAWCRFFSDIGFDHRFKPVTFTLETGTWIELDLAVPNRALMARIVSGRTANEVEVHVPWAGGMRFLPFRLTEVTALRPSLLRRHFLEIFIWKPLSRNQWTLTWVVSEVARGTLEPILVEDVWTIEADQPPADGVIDVTRLAGIRINALGDAEWVILDEKNPRSEAIATPAERDEVAALERAARAAEENLDRSVTRDPNRAPALSYDDAKEGCWDLLTYGWSADRTEAITIWLDRNALQPGGGPQTFAVGQQPNAVITAHVFDRARRPSTVCDDALAPGDTWERWRATSGVLTIELTPVVRVQEPGAQRATVRLVGAQFVSADGRQVAQSQPIALSAIIRIR